MKSRLRIRSVCLPEIAAKRGVAGGREESRIPSRRTRPQFRSKTAIPKVATPLMVVASLLSMTGCQTAPGVRADNGLVESAPYMTLDEFSAVVAGKSELTLVEFCVPAGCARCDEMRGPIDGLATDRLDEITVRRVNLRQYPALAWEFDVTVCPSYVAFRDGEEVFRAAHPVSADLIAAGLEDALHESSTDRLSIAVQ